MNARKFESTRGFLSNAEFKRRVDRLEMVKESSKGTEKVVRVVLGREVFTYQNGELLTYVFGGIPEKDVAYA